MMLSMNQTLVNLDVGETDMNIESLIQFTAVLRLNNQSLHSITLNRILGPPGHILQTDLVAQAIEQTLSVSALKTILSALTAGRQPGHEVWIVLDSKETVGEIQIKWIGAFYKSIILLLFSNFAFFPECWHVLE